MKIMNAIFFAFFFLTSCQHPEPARLGVDNENVPLVTEAKDTTAKAKVKPHEPKAVDPKIRNCTCVEMWMPVCGTNGKTYSNSCFANCAGVTFSQGKCDDVIKE